MSTKTTTIELEVVTHDHDALINTRYAIARTRDHKESVRDGLALHGDYYNQDEWLIERTNLGGECVTVACFAGWACKANGKKHLGIHEMWSATARDILGLHPFHASAIFFGRWPEALRGFHPEDAVALADGILADKIAFDPVTHYLVYR